jgi:hypothetical protein
MKIAALDEADVHLLNLRSMTSQRKRHEFSTKQSTQLVGLLLWRFGLLLASAAGLYRVTKFLMQFVELPKQLEIGIGLMICGAFLFAVSMVMERIVDSRSEGHLGQ